MSRWFRHYAGMMRDDKLVRAALRSKQSVERVCWLWGAILESAAEFDDGGRYEIDHAEIAYFLRADESEVAAIEAALGALGRLEDGCVAKWKDRQFQGDRTGGKSRGADTYVYFIGSEWGQPVKIGFSRNPWSRVVEFQTGSATKLNVLGAFKTSANSEVEIHTLLASYRKTGEWFDLPSQHTKIVADSLLQAKKPTYEELLVALRAAGRSATITETDTELEVDAAQSRKRSRAELDRLEADLREAAGFQTNPSPGLFVLAPILGLLDIGYDIEADILPTVRAVASRMKRPARSWDYFVEPIREAIADRQAVAARGRAPPGKQSNGTGRTNVFERLKGQADERGGQDGSSGPVVDAIRSIPDLRRQDERDDGQGVPAGDRWVFPARAS